MPTSSGPLSSVSAAFSQADLPSVPWESQSACKWWSLTCRNKGRSWGNTGMRSGWLFQTAHFNCTRQGQFLFVQPLWHVSKIDELLGPDDSPRTAELSSQLPLANRHKNFRPKLNLSSTFMCSLHPSAHTDPWWAKLSHSGMENKGSCQHAGLPSIPECQRGAIHLLCARLHQLCYPWHPWPHSTASSKLHRLALIQLVHLSPGKGELMKNCIEILPLAMLTTSFFSSFLHFYFCNYFSPFLFPPLPPLIGGKTQERKHRQPKAH